MTTLEYDRQLINQVEDLGPIGLNALKTCFGDTKERPMLDTDFVNAAHPFITKATQNGYNGISDFVTENAAHLVPIAQASLKRAITAFLTTVQHSRQLAGREPADLLHIALRNTYPPGSTK